VGYKVDFGKKLQYSEGGNLIWKKIGDENAHIGITVHDTEDLNFIQGLTVTVSIYDDQGNLVGNEIHPFYHRPWLLNYGLNWTLPGDGRYTLHVCIDFPEYLRHGWSTLDRPQGRLEVDFKDVEIKTGQKIS
jgi:hypothetical protein